MTKRQIQSRLTKFLKDTLSKYQVCKTDKKDDFDKTEYYIKIRDELLKYYSAEDVFIQVYGITEESGSIEFSIDHPKRNPETGIYMKFVNIPGNISGLNIWIYYCCGSSIDSEWLSIEMFPEVVKAFIELDNSFDKVLEEIEIEKGKDKKISDMIGVTIKTLIEKRFGDRISQVDTFLNGNTLIVNVKSSKNKAIFKIDIKKFEMDIKEFKNNFEVILNEVEYFLKLPSYDWLKFEYRG